MKPVETEIIDINCIEIPHYYDNEIILFSKMYLLAVKYSVDGIEYIIKNTQEFTTLDDEI